MASLASSSPVPSELNDEVNDADLPFGLKWAYPCKLPSCPNYSKSWGLQSPFLLYLQQREVHKALATIPAACRTIEIDWRYTTDPYLPPRAAPDFRSREDTSEHVWNYSFKDKNGRVITGRGTQKQIEMHMASREEGTPDA
ncbi:uncharacterized protein K444DRAFT_523720 [Hyaloscypha bicolor E]|jgi:hypothetical protein|uniref:Uncharacterized protein n=1 Tax=Hyaloscypha bicolor E TaxID=1095630 RepID=A0A2J6THZ1_9HELO|nr:uncharacterized protein K444DRAFT_523720 [Hyaloscypha bicolor E]PMD62642.1 hypothetical protein K444DRAFT_523720 [Hyaloscypha bicolor E]